jgi:hypothetical protein
MLRSCIPYLGAGLFFIVVLALAIIAPNTLTASNSMVEEPSLFLEAADKLIGLLQTGAFGLFVMFGFLAKWAIDSAIPLKASTIGGVSAFLCAWAASFYFAFAARSLAVAVSNGGEGLATNIEKAAGYQALFLAIAASCVIFTTLSLYLTNREQENTPTGH